MRLYGFLLLPLAVAILLGTPPVEGQDSPLIRLFSGEKTAYQAKRGSSNQIEKENRRGFGGPKRVEINLTEQKLRAYEGNRLVMQTHISSGRGGATPTGSFTAGPYKAQNHYSSLYHGAHMPWSVQVNGHIFIHGFSSVPNYPASHGCIRVPITGTNPARRFYNWVDVGTPIRITY